MEVNFLKLNLLNRVPKVKMAPAQNPIAFRGNSKDAFTKTDAAEKFKQQQEFHPETAFLYNPALKAGKKRAMVLTRPHLVERDKLAQELGLPHSSINPWIKAGVLAADVVPGAGSIQVIDKEFKPNKDFIEFLKGKSSTLKLALEFGADYNINLDKIGKWLESGDLEPLGLQYAKRAGMGPNSIMLDIDNPTNKKTIEKHLKTTPMRSEKYFKQPKNTGEAKKSIMVPVTYLSKLGFGSPVELANLIQKGEIAGIVEKVYVDGALKYKVAADIAPYIASEDKLKLRREINPYIVEANEFVKNLNIRHSDLKAAMLEDEVQIVPEFIFEDDYDKVFINLNEPKNQNFIEKTFFEQEAANEIKRIQKLKRKEEIRENKKNTFDLRQSKKMKIAWQLCPNTRAVAIKEAENDGYLASVLEKKSDGEDLTQADEIKLNSYRKSFWKAAGTGEFKRAVYEASRIMEQFEKEGIDSIKNEEIKNILLENQVSI